MGQPTKFKEIYSEWAEKMSKLGATDKAMADFFGVPESTLNNWKKKFPDFKEAIKRGKEFADMDVADSLYQRAKGYSHDEELFFQYKGKIISKKTTKHYPPDTTAALRWLENRQPDYWKNKTHLEATGAEGKALVPSVVEIVIGGKKIHAGAASQA